MTNNDPTHLNYIDEHNENGNNHQFRVGTAGGQSNHNDMPYDVDGENYDREDGM